MNQFHNIKNLGKKKKKPHVKKHFHSMFITTILKFCSIIDEAP